MAVGPMEIGIVAAIVMIIFGPSQLPKLGRSLGQTIKEFRGIGKELTEVRTDVEAEVKDVTRALK